MITQELRKPEEKREEIVMSTGENMHLTSTRNGKEIETHG